jgi:hypothetical protein
MRKISRHPRRLIGLCAIFIAASPLCALADDTNFYQSNTQYGVSLPNTSLPTGSDEVRAADGTSCRSAVGGDGAYMDTGVIGSPGQSDSDFSGAVYTRLVVPLGGRQKRLNCESLYELEIQRLRMELDLARMGLSSQGSSGANWQNEGWSSEGTKHKTAAAAPVNTVPPKKTVEKAAKKSTPEPVPAADTPIVTSLVIISDSLY